MTGRWVICATVTLALISAGILGGIVQRALFSDQTGIVWLVVGLGIMGSISSRWFPALNDWLCEHGMSLMLGLLGTVIGFMGAIIGATTGDVTAKLVAVETALSTTMVGLVVHMYLLIMQRLMR